MIAARSPWSKALPFIALAVACGGASAQVTRADKPTVHVGDAWVYQVTDSMTQEKRGPARQVVTEVTPEKIVIRLGKSERTYTPEFNLTEIKVGDSVTFSYDPAFAQYSFPLEVGKEYSSQFRITSRSGQRVSRHQWRAKVVGAESVTTPAGTFDTLKIEIDGSYNTEDAPKRWSGTRKETIWYAPAVNRHVKYQFSDRWAVGDVRGNIEEAAELVSYTPKKN